MVTKRLKTIFFISIPIFITHGLEEYFNGFYNADSSFKFFFQYFDGMPIPQATFLLFQIMLWLLLIVAAFLIASEKWRMRLMILPGLIYVFELHHFWAMFESGSYYPGVVTATAFPIIGFLFLKELLMILKSNGSK